MGFLFFMKLRLISLLHLMHQNIMTRLKLLLIILSMLLQVLQSLFKLLLSFRQGLFGGLLLLLQEGILTLPECFISVIIGSYLRKRILHFKVKLLVFLYLVLKEYLVLRFCFVEVFDFLFVLFDLIDMLRANCFGLSLKIIAFLDKYRLFSLKP